MSLQGWIFMISAWTFVLALFFYCFYRILSGDSAQQSG
ncbi:MAG: hypothetical protein KatS3mg021_2652 [Fimbriimonadales bacterium]|jgi:hypothetical protein|nr:MAG: hypothetical protein KatS3mg021_2652 [Fimbriimonadales bacterium]